MIHVSITRYLTSDKRLVDSLVMKNKDDRKAVICLKVGIGRSPVKLLQGDDYHSLVTERGYLRKYLDGNVWKHGKKIKLDKRELILSHSYDVDDPALLLLAQNFNAKAGNAVAFVTGAVSGTPLGDAIKKKNQAKINKANKEKAVFYTEDNEAGMF